MSVSLLRNKKRVGWFLQQPKKDKNSEIVLIDVKTKTKYIKWEKDKEKEKETEWDALIKKNLLPDYLQNRDLYTNI